MGLSLLLFMSHLSCMDGVKKEKEKEKEAAEVQKAHSAAPGATPPTLTLDAISKAVSSIASQANKAIVLVSTAKTIEGAPFDLMNPFDYFFGPGFGPHGFERPPKETQEGLGSGFFIDLDKGYIVTNNHVIEGVDEIVLKVANGEKHGGVVLGRDKRTDVAMVKIGDKSFHREGLGVLSFADSNNVSAGEFVIALGAPFGLEASVSFGVVSATGRGNLNLAELGDFIQTDAAINPGNSGGPLLNTDGQVVGVNTAIYSATGVYNGIGFAVPSNLVKRVVEELIRSGKVERGFLGVSLQHLDPAMIESMNLPPGISGALITNIADKSPAKIAGIEIGDVITAVNGIPIKSEVDLSNSIGLMQPGTKVKLTIVRGRQEKSIEVKLINYPGDRNEEKESTEGETELHGLRLRPLEAVPAKQLGIESKEGAFVESVAFGSPAARAGLERGDVILLVNGKVVREPKDFWDNARGKDKLLLRIERQGNYFFVNLRTSSSAG